MHVLTIDSSPTQLRKLRKGQGVRIKKGTGFNLIVHPTTYKLASRAFNKDKGITIKLSPEELEANKNISEQPEQLSNASEVHGEIVGRGIWSSFKKIAKSVLKPIAKMGVSTLANMGGNMLGNIPIVGGIMKPLAQNVGDYANRAIDGAGLLDLGYRGGASRGQGMHRGCGFGFTGMSDISKATKGYADAGRSSGRMAEEAINARRSLSARPSYEMEQFAPRSRGYGMSHHIVGRGGGMIGNGSEYYPPALVSQPYSANYQMSHFLPVQYQHYNNSMYEPFSRQSSGNGLYM